MEYTQFYESIQMHWWPAMVINLIALNIDLKQMTYEWPIDATKKGSMCLLSNEKETKYSMLECW